MTFFRDEKCTRCGECFTRCQYLNLSRAEAIAEIKGLIAGTGGQKVMKKCVSCYACDAFCPYDARPYALILERCQDCHEMDKTCLVQSDDAQWWQTTVLRMVEYKGELLTADEAATVSAFLADPQKRASVCTPK